MARKNKNLAGFGDVANVNINNNDNENNNVNVDNIESIEKEHTTSNDEFLDQLIEGNQKKKKQAKVTGVYLEPELEKILDQLARKGGKGAKSKIVNESLRLVFERKGLI